MRYLDGLPWRTTLLEVAEREPDLLPPRCLPFAAYNLKFSSLSGLVARAKVLRCVRFGVR